MNFGDAITAGMRAERQRDLHIMAARHDLIRSWADWGWAIHDDARSLGFPGVYAWTLPPPYSASLDRFVKAVIAMQSRPRIKRCLRRVKPRTPVVTGHTGR